MHLVQIIRDPTVIEGYLTDASNTRGHADALVRPRSTEEVAEVVAHCQAHAIPLTVTARRTSTTAAPVPEGGWLLSTERLDRIIDLDQAEAGVILGRYQAEVERAGRIFPPDPTSRNEASLGAAIACNASGARTFRYGPTRRWVVAVEAVLPTGEVVTATRDTPLPEGWPRLHWDEPAVKTAAGYAPSHNLLDLMVGQEGTLGVITRARLWLAPAPPAVLSMIAFFADWRTAVRFVERARQGAERPDRPARPGALNPRAIEYFDRHCLALVPNRPDEAEAALFLEVEHAAGLEGAVVEMWGAALEEGGALVEHTIVTTDEPGRERLYAVRHAIPAGLNEQAVRNGMPKVGTDFAVPDAALPAMMERYESVDRLGIPWALFGHIGDNHLHLNLLPRNAAELARCKDVCRELALEAVRLGGTVSAEHGIGKLKRQLLSDMVGPAVIARFRALKAAADPNWILGRGTLLAPPP